MWWSLGVGEGKDKNKPTSCSACKTFQMKTTDWLRYTMCELYFSWKWNWKALHLEMFNTGLVLWCQGCSDVNLLTSLALWQGIRSGFGSGSHSSQWEWAIGGYHCDRLDPEPVDLMTQWQWVEPWCWFICLCLKAPVAYEHCLMTLVHAYNEENI